MKLEKAVELMEIYQNCPSCGNGMIGNGEGSLQIEDDMFKRTCKCGYVVTVFGLEEHPSKGEMGV